MEFLDISSLGVAYQYTTIWAWEPLTAKSKKGWPQLIEKRIEKRWTVSGQPVQATSKEGYRKDKERYREVVWLP
jgi:hypothetical protein